MVDAEDRLLWEMLQEGPVERLRRFAIAAERFLDDKARVNVETALGERGNDDAKEARGNREIVQRPLGAAERLLQLCESLRVVVIAVDISQEAQQFVELRGISPPMLFDAVCGSRPQLFDRPARLGDADDGHIDAFVADEAQKRGEDLLEGKIAGCAEEHQGVGLGGLHLISSRRCDSETGPMVDTSARGAAQSNHTPMDMAN